MFRTVTAVVVIAFSLLPAMDAWQLVRLWHLATSHRVVDGVPSSGHRSLANLQVVPGRSLLVYLSAFVGLGKALCLSAVSLFAFFCRSIAFLLGFAARLTVAVQAIWPCLAAVKLAGWLRGFTGLATLGLYNAFNHDLNLLHRFETGQSFVECFTLREARVVVGV